MTVFATTLYFDKPIATDRLAHAFAVATGLPVSQVIIITQDEFDRASEPWFRASDRLGLKTSQLLGDFPFVVDMVARSNLDLRAVLKHLAQSLHTTLLTDEFEVNPLSDAEWLMVDSDGSSTRVIADPEAFGADDPAIILEPESRAIHEAKRSRRVIAAD
jgi:hypothetical protein